MYSRGNYILISLEVILVIMVAVMFGLLIKDNQGLKGELSQQRKYTIYLGTNDKDTLKQEIPTETIKEQMHEICIKYVDGYTLSIADGFYRDDDGNITHEISLVYVFIDVPLDSIQKIMDEALIKFNQGSILLEESKGRSTFYSGNKR